MPIRLDDFSKSLLVGKSSTGNIKLDDFSQEILNSAPSKPPSSTRINPTASPTAPLPEDALSLGQRILTKPVVSKTIDALNGGQSLRQAEDVQIEQAKNLNKFFEPYVKAPGVAFDAAKTLTRGGLLQPNAPEPTTLEVLDSFGKLAGVAATPFVPAAGGILGSAHALMKNKPMAKTILEGIVDPSTAPMMTSTENVPLTKFEREGGVERLIPRAIMQGVEQYGLGVLMGVPGAVKRGYEGAKVRGIEKDFEAEFSKIDPASVQAELQKQGLFSENMTPQQKADVTQIALNKLKEKLQNDPNIGDYLAQKQTPIKLAKDFNEQLGERGQMGGLPEGNKIPNDRQENIVRDQTGVPVPLNIPSAAIPGDKSHLGNSQEKDAEAPIVAWDSNISREEMIKQAKETKQKAHQENSARSIIEQAGGKFNAYDSENNLFVYETPSRSTQYISPDKLSVENVKAKIDKFENEKLQNSSTQAPPIGQPSNATIGLEPPLKPPADITAVSHGPEEQPQFTETSKTEPSELQPSETTTEERAQYELETMDYTKGLHPLEFAIKDIGKIRAYKGGKELEEHAEIPRRFKGKDGVALDEARDMLNSMGWDFQSDSELRAALKELGDRPQKFVLSKATQSFLKNKENVSKLGKALEAKIPSSKYKSIVYSSTGIKKTETPLSTTEEKMFRKVLAGRAKGAKIGFSAGKKEGIGKRAELISELKRKYQLDAQMRKWKGEVQTEELVKGDKRVRTMLIQYVKDNLPVDQRGQYLEAVERGRTAGELINTFRRVDRHAGDIQRKEIIKEIREESKKSLESGKVAVDYKKMIEEITGGIELSKRRPETLDRLRRTREHIESQREKGKDVEMPDRIMKQLEILNRRPADQLTIGELKNIVDNIKDLARLGTTKQNARENIYAMQRERITNDLISGTVALEKNPLIVADPGEKLTSAEKFQNVFGQFNQFLQHLDLVITPMDTYFDLLDGGHQKFDGPNYRHIKKTTDTNYQSYLKMSNKYVDQALTMARDLKLDDQSFERVGIHAARMQKDGIQKLIDTGLTQAQIDKIELTDDEIKFYKMMRKSFDDLRPQVAETMREVYNQPLGEVDNYVSFMTDFSKMSDTEVYRRVGENAVEVKRPTKTPEKGFTKERTGGTQAIKLNAMDIYLRHIDNVSYLVNMSRDNKMLFEVINSKEYGKVAGDLGQRMALEWIDTISRKGGLAGEQRIAILDILRRNFGLAQLGLNATSALIQPTALLDGAAVIGGHAFDGAYKVITDREVRKFVLDNMPEVKNRIGDDPAFLDFGENKFMSKMSEIGFAPLKFFDGITAMGVAHGAYLKKMRELDLPVDLEKPSKEALSYAQEVVRQTQSSSLFKDAPPAIARGKLTGNRSFDKALLQFQSFMLTRWNIIRNYVWRANVMGGRSEFNKSRDFKKAFLAVGMLTLALIAEIQARRSIRSAQDSLTGKMPDKKASTFSDDFLQNIVTTVPFVSQMVSMAVYRGDPIPSFTGARKVIQGTGGLIKAGQDLAHGKEVTDKSKLMIDTAAGAGSLLGIPGTAQLSKTAKSEIDSNTKANVSKMYRDAILNNDKELTKKADKLANEQGFIIEDLEKNAIRAIRKDITDLYEDAILKNDKRVTAKADAIAEKLGLDDDERAELEDAAARRIDKAQENKERLEEQQSEYRANKKSPMFEEASRLMGELLGAK